MLDASIELMLDFPAFADTYPSLVALESFALERLLAGGVLSRVLKLSCTAANSDALRRSTS